MEYMTLITVSSINNVVLVEQWSPPPLLHWRPPAQRRISCSGLPTPSCGQLDITGVRSVPPSASRTLPAPLPPRLGAATSFYLLGMLFTLWPSKLRAIHCAMNLHSWTQSAQPHPPLSSHSMLMICIIIHIITIKSIITLVLKILIMSDVFDFLPVCRRYSTKRTVIKRSHSSDQLHFLEIWLQ